MASDEVLKARRLTEAACKRADGAPDILSVALDFGYGSHEAFTRASATIWSNPEQVRNRRDLDGRRSDAAAAAA